jgi:hypothetical protein
LKHCAASLKVAGSIPDGGVGCECKEYFLGVKGNRCIGLTLPSSPDDSIAIWKPQFPGNLRACPGLYRDCFTFYR